MGRIVLFEADHPKVAAAVDGASLAEAIRRAAQGGASAAFARSHPDLVADRFLYLVFHAARVMDRGMVVDRIDRALRLEQDMVDDVAATLGAGDVSAIARVGMRRDSPACVHSLVEAIRTRNPEALAPGCAPPA